ncbi:hypothetical protein HO291_003484 [Salmonella enterica]|nr:hypothetical protein [Salmonella enterica]
MANTTTPDPREGTGRESIVPPQVDATGNSIVTGKPYLSAFDLQIKEAENRKVTPQPDFNWPNEPAPKPDAL